MVNKIHFLYCPFTGLGLHGGFRGNAWLRNRLRVFENFVLPSLLNQSKREFILWVSWRPEERENPIVQAFKERMDGIRGFTTVFTYGGLCFYDDKYGKPEANARLLSNLSATLPDLEPYVRDADEVYMTIQPSDDVYMSNLVETVANGWPEKRQAMGFTRGYIMDYATGSLAEYNPETTPPFATIKFRKEVFVSPGKHFLYIGPYESHEYLGKHLNEGFWPERGFIVGTHGENISTVFNHPYQGRKIEGKEKEKILLAAGIYLADPIVIRKGARLLARRVLNRLPFQEKIREIYHRLPAWLKFF